MATLALAAVGAGIGTAIGGTVAIAGVAISAAAVGFAVGGAIGAYIDANYLFAPDPINVEGGRLDDLILQTATEGKGINECYGRESRVGAQVLYLSTIRETVTTEQQGGGGKGGGGGVDVSTYSYDCDIALGICRGNIQTQTAGTNYEDAGVRKIWANGKLIYDAKDDLVATGTFSVTGRVETSFQSETNSSGLYSAWYGVNRFVLTCTQAGAFADWPSSTTRVNITSSSISTSEYDNLEATKVDDDTIEIAIPSGTIIDIGARDMRLVGGRYPSTNPDDYEPFWYYAGLPDTTNTKYPNSDQAWPNFYTSVTGSIPSNPLTLTGGAASNETLTITAEREPWKAGLIDSASFYRGSQLTANSTITNAKESGGTAPSWYGIAYVVINGLQLGDFGNSIPQFNFLVNKSGAVLSGKTYGETVDNVISDIMSDAGFSGSQYDVSGIDNTRTKNGVYGYTTNGAQTLSQKLKPLMVWHDIRLREENGKLYFFDGDNAPTTTASNAELGCRTEGEDVQQEILVTDTATYRLPSEINVTYYDRNKDCQQGTEKAQKANYDDKNVRNFNAQMTSYAGKARQRAAQMLYEIEAYRRTAKFRLPPNRIDVAEGDMIDVVTESGETYSVRAMKVDRGANYIHEIEGRIEGGRFEGVDDDLGEDGEGGQDTTYTPPVMISTVWTGPALTDDGTLQTQVVVGSAAVDPTATFLGAVVYISYDYGTNYSQVGNLGSESQVVEALTVLGDHFDADVIDRVNTVDVKVYHGSLSSATDEVDMLNGSNRVWIGQELIGYTTATQQADVDGYPVWRLSGLLRNLRGQIGDGRMGNHAIGDVGCVINNAGAATPSVSVTIPYAKTDLNCYIKVVPVGSQIADTPVAFTFFNSAQSCRCHCPALFDFIRFTSALDNSGGGIANLPALSFQPDDIIIRFQRRGRSLVPLFSPVGMPNLTGKEQFRVNILDADGDIIRSFTHDSQGEIAGATNYPKYGDKFQVVYTAAQQTTDFGSAQSSVDISAWQLGQIISTGNLALISG